MEYDWTRATDALLATVSGLTDAAAAERYGVSEPTVNRWRTLRKAGEQIAEPRGKPREALLSLIGEQERPVVREEAASYDAAPPFPYDIEREELELARIAREPDPVLRALERESIGGVIRAQALREIAWGNRIAEQNAARREESIRGIATGRPSVGGVISDETILDVVLNPQQPKRAKASGE